jgi:hypothetical protein
MAAVDAYTDPAVKAKMYTDLTQYSNRRSTEGPYADNLDIDVLIVGAGFGMLLMANVKMVSLMQYRRRVLFEDSERSGVQDCHLRGWKELWWHLAVESLPWSASRFR